MHENNLVARYANQAEIANWEDLQNSNPGGPEFLGSRGFASLKASVGWLPRHVVFEGAHKTKLHSTALVLERSVPLLGKIWYVPRGPAATTEPQLAELLGALKVFAQQKAKGVFLITCEPPIKVAEAKAARPITTADLDPSLLALGARPRPAIQGNANTAVVDIDRSDAELMASFDKKCRNMIRRAERDEVQVVKKPATQETFDQMHRLMRLVGGGKADLVLRSKSYAETLWRAFDASGEGQFYAIEVDGEPVVMSYMITVGDRAFYKDGGSERDRVMPGMSNLIIWQMMRDARDSGAKELDLFGIAPPWAKSTADHPSYGLGLFKLSFVKERTDYIGAFDLALNDTKYRLWNKYFYRLVSKLHRRKYQDISLY